MVPPTPKSGGMRTPVLPVNYTYALYLAKRNEFRFCSFNKRKII